MKHKRLLQTIFVAGLILLSVSEKTSADFRSHPRKRFPSFRG